MFSAVLSIAILATSAGPAPAQTTPQGKGATQAPADFSNSPVIYDEMDDCDYGLPAGHMPHGWCARGDMYPHYPYMAQPKFYYYFRPYQFFHIPRHQAEVLNYGGDPRNPYDNKIFRNIYDSLEEPEPLPKIPVPAIPDDSPAPPAEPVPPSQASRHEPKLRKVSPPNELRTSEVYGIYDHSP
jgi:hypothetical protein